MKTMIKNKGIWFSALASVMMMTACNSEEDVFFDKSNELTGREIYATGAYDENNPQSNSQSNPQSRMSYEDNFETNRINLAWSKGDAFSAFIYGNSARYDFKIGTPKNGKTYTASETFKCDNFSEDVTNGTIINAIYPSSLLAEGSSPKSIALDLDKQEQKCSGSTDHLKKYDYMLGYATYSSSTPDSLNFNFKKGEGINSGRLASIYRIKMALPSTVTNVSKIEISCKDAYNNPSLVTNDKMDITIVKLLGGKMGTVTLDITEGKVENGEFVAYVMLFPSAVKERTITVTAKEGEVEKTFTDTKIYDSEVYYSRGEFKYINLDFMPKNFKSEYIQDDFKMWSEDVCKDAPSYDDMLKYINAGVYWDNGSKGAHQQTYTVTDRFGKKGTYHTGLWVMKMKYIDELGTSAGSSSLVIPTKGRPVKNIDKYFFLPAAGATDYTDSYTAGIDGVYWSQTRKPAITMGHLLPYALIFNEEHATVFSSEANIKILPMVCE